MRALALVALVVALLPSAAGGAPAGTDWPLFGFDSARHDASPDTRITAANVGKLARHQVTLDGTVDSSPISVGGRIVVTTTYGRTEAIEPAKGTVLWRFTPAAYDGIAGS